MCYGIIIFYYFLQLKKELENLSSSSKLDQSTELDQKILFRINPNRYLREIMEILDMPSEKIIIDTSNDIIINQGTTYLAGILQASFTPDMINFYSEVIAKKVYLNIRLLVNNWRIN